VERKEEGGSFTEVAQIGENITTYTDGGLTYGRSYTYRIKAFTSQNESGYSNVTNSVEMIIQAPTNLIAQSLDDQSIKLTWTDNCEFESGFRLERDEGNGFVQVAEVDVDITTYTDESLNYGQSYSYRVKAFTTYYESGYSNEIWTLTIFPAPTNLTANQISNSEILLTWTDNCSFESGFIIDRKEEGGSYSEITRVNANITQFTNSGLYGEITYTYSVAAYTDSNVSDFNESSPIRVIQEGLVYVPSGSFTMGDVWGDGESFEKPTHQVTLSSFYIGKYEVTQKEYETVMGRGESWLSTRGAGDSYPAYLVSWFEAVEYCNKLSEAEGLSKCYTINDTNVTCNFSANGYRLPTEAEWEYAARSGGRDDRKYSGTNIESELGNYAWYSINSDSKTHPAGTKKANDLGIYDMSGNVWEWCWDWFDSIYYSTSSASNPTGPNIGNRRVIRGGSWFYGSYWCRTAFRGTSNPSSDILTVTFRILRNDG